jgi:hypothetical protein
VAGEIYIGGAGVASGYLDRAELTAESFLPDPFGEEAGARIYKTGDAGRWLLEGVIEFLGRRDYQVKIRGFRIELGEIEARLAEHAAVKEAVVLAHEVHPGDKQLVAYVVTRQKDDVTPIERDNHTESLAKSLRNHLGQHLPEYMIPAAYVYLESLPLTPNGKLDRRALPAPEGEAYVRRGYEAPQGETERKLAQIWAETLKVERIGRHDNFFELGGHSLLALTVIGRMRREGMQADVRKFFITPTLAELAAGMKIMKEIIL